MGYQESLGLATKKKAVTGNYTREPTKVIHTRAEYNEDKVL